MKYNREKHYRRFMCLRGYDYFDPGGYFASICTWQREYLFWEINNGVMRLNEYGRIVEKEWFRTGNIRINVDLDEFVIMPNHLHGILLINNRMNALRRGVLQYAPARGLRSPSQTIGAIIRGFKSAATKSINLSRRTPGRPLWQRNYFEHVIKNENELFGIREYIRGNPLQWNMDEDNPKNI